MAYKSKGGCTPITAKIQKTTKGGIVQPLLNMGAPVKMKASSPAKNMNARQKANESRLKARKLSEAAKAGAQKALELKKAKELASKEFVTNKRGRKVKNPKYQAPSVQPVSDKKSSNKKAKDTSKKSSGKSMTPYSVEGGKGVIHGPKVSYDMAYKNRDMKTYGGMSKADYIKEAKRQTKSFKNTGKWDAAKTVSMETKQPTASTEIKPQTKKAPQDSAKKVKDTPKPPKAQKVASTTSIKPSKQVKRISRRAEKTRQKGIEALESGNSAKALRLKRREARINKRAKRQADKAIEPKSPAKQTAKQQQQKQKREKELARAKFIKKAEKKGNLKELKKNPPKVKRVYK